MQFLLSFINCIITTKTSTKIREEAAKNHNHNQTNNGALEADSESYQFLFSFIQFFFSSVIPSFFCFNTREADDDDEV